MEQRRKEQDYKDKKEKRRLLRVFKAKFKIKDGSSSESFARRIIQNYYGKVDFGWEYYRMVEWCSEQTVKKKQNASLARFATWIKRKVEWDQDKLKNNENENTDGEDEYRKQSRELREQYGGR